MMGGGMMGAMGLWMVLGVLVAVALLVFTVLGIVWLVRRTEAGGSSASRGVSADELLRARYAAGEIDEQEYRRRRSGLS